MRYQNSLSMPSDKPAASSAGYTLLLYVGAIIKQAVIAVASQWVIEQLYASVEAFLKSEHPGHLFE
jgi:hypothetical protein